jgi:antitoxin PrlF
MDSLGSAVSDLLEAQSTLTDRYQTTVPESVRRALHLGKRDRIRYTVRANGEVVLSRAADPGEGDPALGPFLAFLAADIERHPERLEAVDAQFVARLRTLVQDVEVDLEAPLDDAE